LPVGLPPIAGSAARGQPSRLTVAVRAVIARPVALVTVAIVGLALGAGAITVAKFGDQSAADADDRLGRHADAMAGDLAAIFNDASRDLRLAHLNAIYPAALSRTNAPIVGPQRDAIETGISYVAERYNVDEICLIGTTGQEAARWNGGRVAAVADLSADERGNPFFAPALALSDDQVFVTAPYVSPDSHRWVFGFATPILTVNGQTGGVLHFEIPLQRLAETVDREPFSSGGTVMVLDRRGEILVAAGGGASGRTALADQAGLIAPTTTEALRSVADVTGADWQAAFAEAIADPADIGFVTVHSPGSDVRLVARPVAGTDLVVVEASPTSQLYADVDRSRSNLIVTVGPLLALMVALGAWFTVRLVRSNHKLTAATHAASLLAAIVETAEDGILSIGPDGRIATWNSGAAAMYGLRPDEALGQRLDALFAADERDDVPALLEAVMVGAAVERHEATHRTAAGQPFTVSLTFSPMHDAAGAVIGASMIARDISEHKTLEEELARQALHDSLTGLPNRVLFHDRLRQSLKHDRRSDRAATGRHAVLFLDLDDFKLINDTLGHRIGDELLVAVAARLRDAIRSADTAARLGGDEFTVLLENVGDEAEAARTADRILDELRRPFTLDGHQIVVSASIGIAFADSGTDNPDDVLRFADTALYEAKGHGKGRHETYHHTMNVRAWHRLEIETELRLAIARGDLRVLYQPIVDLTTGQLVEVEALVRWEHAQRGLMSPIEFIPLAEQTGLIVPLDAFVLDATCRQLAAWQVRQPAARTLIASVNVSPRDLSQVGYAAGVAAVLDRHGLTPDRIKLEITETTTLDGDVAIATLHELRALGIRVAIDDFGTGYSSLGYFKNLPLDTLKIDRAFVDGLGIEREDTAIVTAAIAFGRALDVEIIAEGIETELQLERLIELGCRLGQGFLFSPPVDAGALSALLGGADLRDRRGRDAA
jgi:diguanylate cyclase (GGDEF)-like protein/PAS domain S-box-containing protein